MLRDLDSIILLPLYILLGAVVFVVYSRYYYHTFASI